MQHVFSTIEKWCSDHEQLANPDKTKLVLFTRKRTIHGFKAPKLFGKEVNLSNSAKVLGVPLDSKLNFNEYINYKILKATYTLWQCRRVYGSRWGLTPTVLMWIYKAIIKPMLSYAAIIWWPRCQLSTVRKALEKVQRLALLGVTAAMKSTPAALEVLLNTANIAN